jgi:hypothetical protein
LELPEVQQFHVNVACLKEDKTGELLKKILDEDWESTEMHNLRARVCRVVKSKKPRKSWDH